MVDSIYPWDEWFSRDRFFLTEGIDFTSEVEGMRRQVYAKASERNLKVSVTTISGSNLDVQVLGIDPRTTGDSEWDPDPSLYSEWQLLAKSEPADYIKEEIELRKREVQNRPDFRRRQEAIAEEVNGRVCYGNPTKVKQGRRTKTPHD